MKKYRERFEEVGLCQALRQLRQPVDWKVLFDLCGLWNPLTHTFFSSSRELTILLEEVSALLGTRHADPSIYYRDAYLLPIGVVGSFSHLKRIFGSVVVPEDLVLDGCIKLSSLWKIFWKQRDSIRSEASCLKCVFILIGGLCSSQMKL